MASLGRLTIGIFGQSAGHDETRQAATGNDIVVLLDNRCDDGLAADNKERDSGANEGRERRHLCRS